MRKKEIRKFDTFAVSARVLGIVNVVFKWFVESKYQNGFDKELVKSEHIHFHYQIQFTLLSFQTPKKVVRSFKTSHFMKNTANFMYI